MLAFQINNFKVPLGMLSLSKCTYLHSPRKTSEFHPKNSFFETCNAKELICSVGRSNLYTLRTSGWRWCFGRPSTRECLASWGCLVCWDELVFATITNTITQAHALTVELLKTKLSQLTCALGSPGWPAPLISQAIITVESWILIVQWTTCWLTW